MKTDDFMKSLGFNSPTTANQPQQNNASLIGHKKHTGSGVYVSPDGKSVISEWRDKTGQLQHGPLKIHVGYDGKACIHRRTFPYVYDVDLLVIETYHGKMPQDGKDYIIFHKDGNIRNNAADNLEWKERQVAYPNTYKATTAPHVKVGDVMVFKDGRVKQGQKELTHETWHGDGDLDMIVPVCPNVKRSYRNRYGRGDSESLYLDDLMDKVGYIDGDKRHFKDPCVLHRDNDWQNFASENLEWVDRSDQRFVDYMNQKEADQDKEGIEINGKDKWDSYSRMTRRN